MVKAIGAWQLDDANNNNNYYHRYDKLHTVQAAYSTYSACDSVKQWIMLLVVQ